MDQQQLQQLGQQQAALRARLRKLNADGQAFLGRAEAENRELNAGEQARIDAIHREFEETEAELERVNSTSLGRVVPPQNGVDGGARRRLAAPKSARFADVFGNHQGADPYAGRFSGLGELCLAISAGKGDPRLIVNSSMTEGSGVSTGFLVPPQFMEGILDGALDQEIVRPNATILPMQSNTLETPGFDYGDGTAGVRAGLKLLWGFEGGTISEQVAKARTMLFSAKKAAILCRVTSELAEDGVAFDRQLSTAMSAAVASGLDGAFISQGTGAGQPLGILNAPCLITVAKEAGQAANTLLVQNLSKMFSRMIPAAYKRSVWLVHPSCLPALLQLAVTVTNLAGSEVVGGSTAGAVTQGPDGLRIYGRPVIPTDAANAFSSAGDVIFADFSRYAIGMRREARIEISRDAFFGTDELGFKLTMRLDGQPLDAAATKLRDGTNTVSPFVALGAR